MSLRDEVAASLPEMRREAESLMVDECTIRRVTGTESGPLGEDVATYADVYTGPCKIQDRGLTPRDVESGSSTADVLTSELHVPVTAGPFAAGDVAFMGGVVAWRVLAPHVKSWQTAQRLPVERVS